MTPFFNNTTRIATLQAVCESWKHTPFMPNAAIKGAGVSCQKLVGAIYVECGALPPDFAVPEGPMNWSRAQKESLIETFMDQQSAFVAVGFAEPGDMLGIKIGGCVHHCGVVFRANGRFVHCLRPDGVRFNNLHDATYWTRIEKIWRPIIAGDACSVEPVARR